MALRMSLSVHSWVARKRQPQKSWAPAAFAAWGALGDRGAQLKIQ